MQTIKKKAMQGKRKTREADQLHGNGEDDNAKLHQIYIMVIVMQFY